MISSSANSEEFEEQEPARDEIVDEPTWDVDDLEAAYRLALEACEAAEESYPQFVTDESGATEARDRSQPDASVTAGSIDRSRLPVDLQAMLAGSLEATNADIDESVANSHDTPSTALQATSPAVRSIEPSVRSVIEACLFVGEPALTIARLREILRNDLTDQRIELAIDELKRMYDDQQRPYELIHQEGAYRLSLRSEYEKLRAKTYGQGPKEIKLSQEAIEVLSVVAYHQPIEEREVNEIYEVPAGPYLKQLLRRELLAVQRDLENPKIVRYITAPRFLSLFQLRRLSDLPRIETFSLK